MSKGAPADLERWRALVKDELRGKDAESLAVTTPGREQRSVNAAENDPCPWIALVAEDLAAVLADVQMTVKPAVG